MTTREETIDDLWERSNHGTQRCDIVAAFEAGATAERSACAELCEQWDASHPDAIAAAIRARGTP